MIAALLACGALSPLSPLPGQLAALCARLDVSGHGITAAPARYLPGPWLSVLTQYQQRETGAAPVRDGCAAAAVLLPGLDGIQFAILGLHNCEDSTIMHMHASGPAAHRAYMPNERYSWAPIWIRDSGGGWHATRTSGQSEMNGRNRATPGDRATAEPRHDLDRGTGNRAIGGGRRPAPAPLGNTLGPASRTPIEGTAQAVTGGNPVAHHNDGSLHQTLFACTFWRGRSCIFASN